MHRTLDEIRTEGLAALRKRLGRSGMIRFLQQFETGRGDYTAERRLWVDETTLAELRRQSHKARPRKRGRKE
jgi:hypothetical protein